MENTNATGSASELWDERYREKERIWSGHPNAMLVAEVTGLSPGRALELGAGEGADAIWLARGGWSVTAVDVSAVALSRAAEHARAAGVDDRIVWQRLDLASEFPAGTFDLVTAHYFHSHGELPREQILRSAAAAVEVGGILLVVGHAGPPSWVSEHEHGHDDLPTPTEVYAALELRDGEFEIVTSKDIQVPMKGPDGSEQFRNDNVLTIRRVLARG